MMAQAIACDLCGQEPAVMLETRIETGEVIAVGASCLIPFYVGAAEALADGITGDEGAAFLPAVTSLSTKWAQFVQPSEEVMPDEQTASEQVHLPSVPPEPHVTGASSEAPHGPPKASPENPERVTPSRRAKRAQDDWVAKQGGEEAIKRRMLIQGAAADDDDTEATS